MVTQRVKAGEELQSWREAWATVDAKKLRSPQRQRLAEALAALQAQVEHLQAELAAGDGGWRAGQWLCGEGSSDDLGLQALAGGPKLGAGGCRA